MQLVDRRYAYGLLMATALAAAVSGCAADQGTTGAAAAVAPDGTRRTDRFDAVAATSEELVAGTLGGVMLSSRDGGRNWTRATLAPPASIIGATACPGDVPVALDFYRKVWVQVDGQWAARPIPGKITPVAMTCDGAGRLWVVGSHTDIAMSGDHGKTWVSTTLGEDAILSTVHFFDPEHGIIGGEFGTVLNTVDGGKTWTKASPLPADFYPYAMYFSNKDRGWVSGVAGAMFTTADGGRTWVASDNPVKASIYAFGGHAEKAYGVGADGKSITLVGDNWAARQVNDASAGELTAVAAIPSGGAMVAGGSQLIQFGTRRNAD